ncbi:MAG TPA: ABC transporter substrate-binding protein [Dongiaceae bacterium]|nr:ABC transporter substrate-binding protein [Dongiaceae bacterium]
MKRTQWLGWSAGALCATAIALGSMAPAQAQDHRGGTLRMVAVDAGGTMDPHINYTLQYWQLYQALYDGLVTFKKGIGEEGFKIVPDLAEDMPQISDDGKTYVFKLRKGIKFWDGREVTVKDVVASMERLFKISSPNAGSWYNVIVGGDDCVKTPATCSLKDGVIGNEQDNTVTFHLTAPDSEFLDKLAVPFGVILPADAPNKDAGTVPIPGTGAYMIASYDPNKQLKMVRNPNFKEWSKDAQPDGYPDTMIMDFGLTDEAEVTAVENGQADWAFDPIPADRLAEVGTKYAKQVHVTPLTAMWYAPLNVNIPPFNNEKARLALSYAVDRNALVKIFGGKVLAQPVCQVLPPNFPGHVDYCPYTKNPGAKWSAPDMAKAKELMKESGTAGQTVTVISEDSAVSKAVGTYLQSVLSQLGYKAELKPISSNIQFTYIQNTNNKVQISVSQWYQDYPAASDFLNVLFSCDNFHPGSDASINISGFCDKDIDAKMKSAMATAVSDPKKAEAMWAEVDKAVTDAAPAVFLFTPKHVDFVSKRTGNFLFNPQYYWMPHLSWVQ